MTETALWRVISRAVLMAIGVLLGLYLLYLLRAVMVQLLMAVIISAGMTPIVDRIAPTSDVVPGVPRRRQPPRALVVLLLYVVVLGTVGLIAALVIPPAVQQVQELTANLDDYVAGFSAWVNGLPERYPFIPAGLGEGLPTQLEFGAAQIQQVLGQAVVVLRLLGGFLGGALNFIFILFLALYMTTDASRISRYLVRLVPLDRRPQSRQILEQMGDKLGGWVRGQLLLCLIIGGITLVGLLLIGVPYAVLLAVVAGLAEAVPMVGPIVSAVPAVIVAFFVSPVTGLVTLGLYILVQQLENALVVPKVMERAVSLHPVAVMTALMVGGELYGVPGAILSVPLTAAISVVVDAMLQEREALQQATTASHENGSVPADAPVPSVLAEPGLTTAEPAVSVPDAAGVTAAPPTVVAASAAGDEPQANPGAGADHQRG